MAPAARTGPEPEHLHEALRPPGPDGQGRRTSAGSPPLPRWPVQPPFTEARCVMSSFEHLAPGRAGGGTLLRLTAGLAHTVNNALTGTLGYLELARRQSRPGTEIYDEIRAAIACAHR